MEKYKRPSKAQITALALTMVMAGGGAYGVMSAANNANAQTNGATEFTTREENAEKFEKKETAETSLTVPNIKFVIDSGLARVIRYNPRLRIEQLLIEKVSQAAANQRQGRCSFSDHCNWFMGFNSSWSELGTGVSCRSPCR